MQFPKERRGDMVLDLIEEDEILNLSSREFIEVRPVMAMSKKNIIQETERRQRRETRKVMDAIDEIAKKIALSD